MRRRLLAAMLLVISLCTMTGAAASAQQSYEIRGIALSSEGSQRDFYRVITGETTMTMKQAEQVCEQVGLDDATGVDRKFRFESQKVVAVICASDEEPIITVGDGGTFGTGDLQNGVFCNDGFVTAVNGPVTEGGTLIDADFSDVDGLDTTDENPGLDAGECKTEVGPGNAPMGSGSLEIYVDSSADEPDGESYTFVDLEFRNHPGTLLETLEASYCFNVDEVLGGTVARAAPYATLTIDTDGDGIADELLGFMPSSQPGFSNALDLWQCFDIDEGVFVRGGTPTPLTPIPDDAFGPDVDLFDECSSNDPCTIDEYVSYFTGARMVNDLGPIGLGAAFEITTDYRTLVRRMNIDAVQVNFVTYDFEP